MQQHIIECLHAIGTMLVSCVVIAAVNAGNGLFQKAIKEDWYENSYHSKEGKGPTVKAVYRVCNEIV